MTEHSVTEFYQVDEPQFRRTVHSQSKNYEQVGIGQNEGNRQEETETFLDKPKKKKKTAKKTFSDITKNTLTFVTQAFVGSLQASS